MPCPLLIRLVRLEKEITYLIPIWYHMKSFHHNNQKYYDCSIFCSTHVAPYNNPQHHTWIKNLYIQMHHTSFIHSHRLTINLPRDHEHVCETRYIIKLNSLASTLSDRDITYMFNKENTSLHCKRSR